jgi:hypothetical protein
MESLALLIDPTGQLYGLLAMTYGTAAKLAGQEGHRALARCYTASAALHGLLAACHFMHL